MTTRVMKDIRDKMGKGNKRNCYAEGGDVQREQRGFGDWMMHGMRGFNGGGNVEREEHGFGDWLKGGLHFPPDQRALDRQTAQRNARQASLAAQQGNR